MPAWADIPDERATVPPPEHGSRGRVCRARGCSGRPRRRRDRCPGLRGEHAGLLHLGRQRLVGRRPERHDQRAARPKRNPDTVDMHIKALDELGGLDVLGSPKVDNQYHAGSAWAGSTPYEGVKLLASHLGGTRNPMVIRWPAKIHAVRRRGAVPPLQRRCSDDLRSRWHHAAPGGERDPPRPDRRRELRLRLRRRRPGRLQTQYFEIMGSRAIYHDGWMASASDPGFPGCPGCPPESRSGRRTRTSGSSTTSPRTGRKPRPRGDPAREAGADEGTVRDRGGPQQRLSHRRWPLDPGLPSRTAHIDAVPRVELHRGHHPHAEFCAPALGNRANLVTIDADMPENTNGVLYSLGGAAAASRATSMRDPLLRVQPVHRHADQDPLRQAPPDGPTRSRSTPPTPSPVPVARSTSRSG